MNINNSLILSNYTLYLYLSFEKKIIFIVYICYCKDKIVRIIQIYISCLNHDLLFQLINYRQYKFHESIY